MYKQETIKPYGGTGRKEQLVEQMFDNIAPVYDTFNHGLSLNIDKGWRRKAIDSLKPYRPQEILDVAMGTGDLTILAAQRLKPRHIEGIDLSEGMMSVAGRKFKNARTGDVKAHFQQMDCTAMTFPDNTFDAVISSFGIRNFQDLDKGLSEMCRVLKKGGHLSVVELSSPVRFPMRQLFRLYAHTILPLCGGILSRDFKAYDYLTASIEAFPQGEQMTGILRKAGFAEVAFRRLTFGICTLYTATK